MNRVATLKKAIYRLWSLIDRLRFCSIACDANDAVSGFVGYKFGWTKRIIDFVTYNGSTTWSYWKPRKIKWCFRRWFFPARLYQLLMIWILLCLVNRTRYHCATGTSPPLLNTTRINNDLIYRGCGRIRNTYNTFYGFVSCSYPTVMKWLLCRAFDHELRVHGEIFYSL